MGAVRRPERSLRAECSGESLGSPTRQRSNIDLPDTVIVGSAISDNVRVAAPYGTVRAFDVRTGEPKWDFDQDREGSFWEDVSVLKDEENKYLLRLNRP